MSIQRSNAFQETSPTSLTRIATGILAVTTVAIIGWQALKLVGAWTEKKSRTAYSQKLNQWIETEKTLHKKENTEEWERTVKERVNPGRKNSTTIHLNDLALKTLPPIYKPEKVAHLDISGNPFEKNPDLTQFTHLKTLLAKRSGLKTPLNLYPLKSLREVDLSENLLTKVPYTNPKIVLNLDYNQIEKLPKFIFKMPNGYSISLNKNRLSKESEQRIVKHLNLPSPKSTIIYDPDLLTPRRITEGKPLTREDSTQFYTPTNSEYDFAQPEGV